MTGLFEKGQKLVITSLAAIKRGIRGLPPDKMRLAAKGVSCK